VKLIIGVIAVVVALVIAVVWADIEKGKWMAANCTPTSTTRWVSVPPIYLKSGDMLIPIAQPDRQVILYRCVNGEEIWR